MQAKGGNIERERYFLLDRGGLGGGAEGTGHPGPEPKGVWRALRRPPGPSPTVLWLGVGTTSRSQVCPGLPRLAGTPLPCPLSNPIQVGVLFSVHLTELAAALGSPLTPVKTPEWLLSNLLMRKRKEGRTSLSQRPPPQGGQATGGGCF